MIHWLVIGGYNYNKEEEKNQWSKLNEYVENNNSKLEIYLKDTGDVFARVVKLICNENYDELKLDVNSSFEGSIRRLSSKPRNISKINKDINYFINYSSK